MVPGIGARFHSEDFSWRQFTFFLSLNRYNSGGKQEATMAFATARTCCPGLAAFSFLALVYVLPMAAQTVHVDVTPTKALAFDPDKAMGTSMDILPAKEFDNVFSQPVIKEGLSAGWGPMTYRQNTE